MFARLDEDIFFSSFPQAAFSIHIYFTKQKELLCYFANSEMYCVALYIYIYIYIFRYKDLSVRNRFSEG